MEYEEARRFVQAAVERRRAIDEDVKDLISESDSLCQVVNALRGLYPQLAKDFPEEGFMSGLNVGRPLPAPPKGSEAVRVILEEEPACWHSLALMVLELSKRGWLPASDDLDAAVRAALERLIARGDPHYQKRKDPDTGRVVYRYVPDGWAGDLMTTS